MHVMATVVSANASFLWCGNILCYVRSENGALRRDRAEVEAPEDDASCGASLMISRRNSRCLLGVHG